MAPTCVVLERRTAAAMLQLPEDFHHVLPIDNARDRFAEALEVGQRMLEGGVVLMPAPDHAAIFTDPPQLVAGPLKSVGYDLGWDARCYPSPVDGCDFINVSARLDENSEAHARGWFRYVAVVHPVDQAASQQMSAQGNGNPFLHHVTWGIAPPGRDGDEDFDYASRLVPFMVRTREATATVLGEEPGTLILALPESVREDPRFEESLEGWLEGTGPDDYQVETMQGGGFLVQYFVLAGGRIEVALRSGTTQTFNPKSVNKISRDEISTHQKR